MSTKNHRRSQQLESQSIIPEVVLSTQQLNAIDLLAVGRTDGEVAETLGLARETVNRWRNHNPYFIGELNKKRAEIWVTARNRLCGMVNKAIDALEKALEGEGSIRAAVEILKAAGIYGSVAKPVGETDPELVLWGQAKKWAEEEFKRRGPGGMLDGLLFNEDEIAALTRQRMSTVKALLEVPEPKPNQ